jgi:glyoxylase-like metal-dependent hydrolase (beta-lactamase superfamily II)
MCILIGVRLGESPEHHGLGSAMGPWVQLPGGALTARSTIERLGSTALRTATAAGSSSSDVVLVDVGVTPVEIGELLDALERSGLTVVAAVHTHAHWDHLLWPSDRLPEVPRWATRACRDNAIALRMPLQRQAAAAIGGAAAADLLSGLDDIQALPGDATVPGISGLQVVAHDGHSRGQLAVLHEATGVLCAGDMLSDLEIPLPYGPGDEWDVPSYTHALELLRPFALAARLVVPGHGTYGTDPLDRLSADEAYLEAVSDGRHSDDPRLALPANAAVDAALRRL